MYVQKEIAKKKSLGAPAGRDLLKFNVRGERADIRVQIENPPLVKI